MDGFSLNCFQKPRAIGLLGLMLLQESRRAARTTDAWRAGLAVGSGSLALESCVDRGRRLTLVERALSSQRFGPYSLQAAIAAVHAEAADRRGD